MTKVIIQIPCFNEAETLGFTLSQLPRHIPGVDKVEWLIIDDGSSDQTVEVARLSGVDHIVRLNGHQGLAKGFIAGLEASLAAGADIIVNTDADNQYEARDIAKLVGPILAGAADVVIGARPIDQIEHFSPAKKLLQRLGSAVVRLASNTKVEDAPSGFRAISRDAAMRMHVFTGYTYTLETIIQAGQSGLRVVNVPIRTNADLRPSRLVRSIPRYVWRSMTTIVLVFMIYQPLKLFLPLGGLVFSGGFLLGLRYLYLMTMGQGAGHIQSVILAAALLGIGSFILLFGVIAHLISTNRALMERLNVKMRRLEDTLDERLPVAEDTPLAAVSHRTLHGYGRIERAHRLQ